MERFLSFLTCPCSREKKTPKAPPRESLRKRSEDHYVLGPTETTVSTSETPATNKSLDLENEELYMDLTTLPDNTPLSPIAPPRKNPPIPNSKPPEFKSNSEITNVPELLGQKREKPNF